MLLLGVWSAPAGALAGEAALQRLADALADQAAEKLAARGAELPILALAVEGDRDLIGREGRLTQELQRLLVFRLEHGTAVERTLELGHGEGALALQRARRSGADWLLRAVVGLKADRLHATADLTPIATPFWEGLVDPLPRGSRYHLFASVEADDEIAVLMGTARAPPALGRWNLAELLSVPGRILDVGLGELDGRPGLELAVLLDAAIEVYTIGERGPRRLVRHSLADLPAARTRTRDPAGSLLVVDFNRDGRFEIFYKHFNHSHGQVLRFTGVKLVPIRELEAVPLCVLQLAGRPTILSGRIDAGTNRYRPELELIDINASSGERVDLGTPLQSVRCWQPPDRPPVAAAVDIEGRLQRLNAEWQVTDRMTGSGAGAAPVDLDLDGRPELVLSESVWPGEPDGLRVFAGEELVWRTEQVVGNIVAVAGSPPLAEEKPLAAVATVESSEGPSRVYLLGR
jgi:hypothetical protein